MGSWRVKWLPAVALAGPPTAALALHLAPGAVSGLASASARRALALVALPLAPTAALVAARPLTLTPGTMPGLALAPAPASARRALAVVGPPTSGLVARCALALVAADPFGEAEHFRVALPERLAQLARFTLHIRAWC